MLLFDMPGNKQFIIGCDEVGTGSAAFGFYVCGVRASSDWNFEGLNDSKKLTPKKRTFMAGNLVPLIYDNTIEVCYAYRSNKEIDEKGLGFCLKEAYVEIFHKLYQPDSLIIVDGNLKFDNLGVDTYDIVSIVKADGTVPTVMAASILAKVKRDMDMDELHLQFPQYNWKKNKGYLVKEHREAIAKYGLCDLHRKSYF